MTKLKIGFISDLHLDNAVEQLNKKGQNICLKSLIKETIYEFAKRQIDLCIISGDISNELSLTRKIIQQLNRNKVKVYYTLGNHDLWIRNNHIEDELNDIKEDDYCLLDKPINIGHNYVLLGMFSWYDPSFDTMGYDHSYYELRKNLWIDSHYITWNKQTNEEVVQSQISKTKKVLNNIPQHKKIILVNHFVPHKDFIIHQSGNDNWNFGNAFMGSRLIDQLVNEDNRINYITFGHTHHHFGRVNKDKVTYLSFPLGYVHEWAQPTYKEQLEQSLGIININA